MHSMNRIVLILVIIYNCCASKVLESDYIYSPLRIYGYPYSGEKESYIYFPTDGHYEVINYHKNPESFKKLESHELSVPKYNSERVHPKYYEVSPPSPFKKSESQKFSPEKFKKIIVSPLDSESSYKKYASKESNSPKKSSSIVKSRNGEVSSLSEGGKKFENSYHKKHGYKTSEGYNTDQKYSKGKKDSYEKKNELGDENSEKKNKESNHEDHEQSEDDDSQGHKEHGEKYNLKKHHKKGSKAKGYHNVFMKDEYKKDHIFYDNADERGHFSKHGSDHTKYHNDDYELKKGSHINSDKESVSSKKQSLTDKKKYDDADESYKKESSHKSNDGNSQEFKFDSGKSGYNVAITHSV